MPAMAEEWPDWDDLSKLVYIEEWSIESDRLGRLAEWYEHDAMSEEQARRYRELLALVEKYDPLRERMFEI